MRLLATFFAIFCLAGCDKPEQVPAPPPVKTDTRELIIFTRVGVTSYTVDNFGSASGFEHDLALKFAEDQRLPSRIVVTASDQDLMNRLKLGEGHLAVAWATPSREDGIVTSHPYTRSRDVIVTHEASLPVRRQEQLSGRTIHVIAGSRQETALRELSARIPGIKVAAPQRGDELELMKGVAERRFDAVLVSDAAYDIGSNYYPELQDALELEPEQPIVWLFSASRSPDLVAKANDFLERMTQSGELARLTDRYFGHVDRLTTEDTAIFIERMRSVLPQYRPLFQEAQIRTGIDWRLLAALAYQESAWKPLATSRTGVRGMMMLTEETADHLNVGNRLDPAESIRAGAQYLGELRDALPAHIRDPDRLWLALAAYNLGMGHLNAARYLAKTLGVPSDSWYEMKKVLPLLAKPQYYKRLKSGRGRGGEAVIMTENIRVYADILNRFEAPYEPLKRKSERFIWKSFQPRPDMDAAQEAP